MMSDYSKHWDEVVKPLAEEVVKNAENDKGALQHFVGAMIFAVEHDLADGQMGLMALNSVGQVSGVLMDDNYYEEVHGATPQEEKDRLLKLGCETKKLMDMYQKR